MKERIENSILQRNKMFSSISHDIRTILTRMRFEIEKIPLNKRKEFQKDLNEMEGIVKEYLDYAKVEKKEKRKNVNITKLLKKIISRYKRKNIIFEEKNNVIISIRENSFKRCINNILSNSVKFGNNIDINFEEKENNLKIIIDDDGPGIPKIERNKVFQPFYQLDDSRNRNKGGVGLGMTIALDIVLSHGGDVLLEDSKLGGLRVIISLPV